MLNTKEIPRLQKSNPFAISYMILRIMNNPSNEQPAQVCIRKVAERLAPKASDIRHYVTSLVTLVVERQDVHSILIRERPWKTPTEEEFERHVQAAAVYMNHVWDVEKWGVPRTTSTLFGSCSALAARFGSTEMVELYLAGQITTNRCEMLPHASRQGRADMVRFIFDYATETVPWRFSHDRRIKIEHVALMRSLKTPSPKIWDFLMEVHKKYKIAPRRVRERWVFRFCCRSNWIAMALHLASRSANIISSRSWGYAADLIDDAADRGHTEILRAILSGRPTWYGDHLVKEIACSRYMEAVRLLQLRYSPGPRLLATAAWRGHGDVVQLFLEIGGDANEEDWRNKKPAIVHAIRHKNKRMFECLIAYGAVLPKGTMREDVLNEYRHLGPDSILAPFLHVFQNSQNLAEVSGS